MRSLIRFLTAVALAAGLVACGDDTTDESADADTDLTIEGAWARTTADGQQAGAVYFHATSEAGNAIVGAAVPTAIAGRVELHETVMAEDAGDDAHSSGSSGHSGIDEAESDASDHDDSGGHSGMGAMTMRAVNQIDLPAGEQVTLEPGGLHVMLLDLAGPLEADDEFVVTLLLADNTEFDVDVVVRDNAPDA